MEVFEWASGFKGYGLDVDHGAISLLSDTHTLSDSVVISVNKLASWFMGCNVLFLVKLFIWDNL